MVHDLAKALIDGKQIDFILLYFSNYNAMKLQRCGVRGKLLKWIDNFLFNQAQNVVLSGEESLYASVASGVPQRRFLGPHSAMNPGHLGDQYTGLGTQILASKKLFNLIYFLLESVKFYFSIFF